MAIELPFVFQIPGITELKEIFYQDGSKLTIDNDKLNTLTKENIQQMSLNFWSDKFYIDSEGNLNPVPFNKITGFQIHGDYILIIVDWTILPAYFEDPKTFTKNQILVDPNRGYGICKEILRLSKSDFNKMVKEMSNGFWNDKCYIKKVPRGPRTFSVLLEMPFSKISNLILITTGGQPYFSVRVDWTNRENSDKLTTENGRITDALINQHGYDADFPPEDDERNNQILRDAGRLGGGKSKKSNKNKKSYKKSKNKKSYKKSKKNKSKKKNKRRGF